MPKVEISRKLFFNLLGKELDKEHLDCLLENAKAEMEPPTEGRTLPDVLKIELNDTNRPDLWSVAGLARSLAMYSGGTIPTYDFFSTAGAHKPTNKKIIVEKSVFSCRPFLAAFIARGSGISEELLQSLIQSQEKICWNYGWKRRTVSMGMYRCQQIVWPVHYKAVDPITTGFIPLQGSGYSTLQSILQNHPKGKEYGYILKDFALHPLLVDSNNAILSYPPIINSADLGAVQVGDTEVLVEFTGTNLNSVLLCANILACDFSDNGYTIEQLEIEYDWQTQYGKNLVIPYYFQEPLQAEIKEIQTLLGTSLAKEEIITALLRSGCSCKVHDNKLILSPPPYRNDFMHQVDIIEEVMIGRGIGSFVPGKVKDFTIGKLSKLEIFSRRVKSIMVGFGFQEMVYNYLGSTRDFLQRMNIAKEEGEQFALRILNPMSENHEYVRPSILPSLLQSEAISAKAIFPHRIFEVGKVAFQSKEEVNGIATRDFLSCIVCHSKADYNEIASIISTLFYYIGIDFTIKEATDSRFILGRQAHLLYKDKVIGIIGELHPLVLEAWSITVPAVAAELDIGNFLE